MPVTASARRTGGPLRCEVELERGHRIVVDEPRDAGGEDTAPTPQQLLAASLASCVAITIEMYLQRKDWEVGEIRVDVTSEESAFEVVVHLPSSVPEDRRQRIMRVATKCPVHRTLASAAEVTDRCELSSS